MGTMKWFCLLSSFFLFILAINGSLHKVKGDKIHSPPSVLIQLI